MSVGGSCLVVAEAEVVVAVVAVMLWGVGGGQRPTITRNPS